MIGKISRGDDTGGLLRYLLGPGRANEHTEPHLVASWDGDPAGLEPVVVDGRPRVRALAALLDQPLDALHRRPTSTVWHCSLRNAPGDRRLSDQEWATAAARVLHGVGLAPADDDRGCRWVAVRHGEDHIHLLVILARQDGDPARTSNDYRRVGAICQELEAEWGLTRTRARDSTAVNGPTRPEREKARRSGRDEATRETLRREVRLASMKALDPQTFVDELHRNGLIVKPRHSLEDPQQLTGYAVAWPGDRAPGGRPVWFSGSTLAPDLSLPRLQLRWEGVRHELDRGELPPIGSRQDQSDWASVAAAVAVVATAAPGSGDAVHLARAAACALLAVARAVEGSRGGGSTRAAVELVDAHGRAAPRLRPASVGERRLLAVAHLVLGWRVTTRASGPGAARVSRSLVELIGRLATAPAGEALARRAGGTSPEGGRSDGGSVRHATPAASSLGPSRRVLQMGWATRRPARS